MKAMMVLCFWGMGSFLLSGAPATAKTPAALPSTYFQWKVYQEHTWKSFAALPSVNDMFDPANPNLPLLNACLFFAVNQVRAMHQRAPLQAHAHLLKAAAGHSYSMSRYHFFDHDNPYEKGYSTLGNRLQKAGIKHYVSYGENIHKTSVEAEEHTYMSLARSIVESWYASPRHRWNMLDSGFEFGMCAASVEVSGKWIYVIATQNFLRD